MSATDDFRSLLDERGVEWEACRVPTLRSELAATFWYDRDGSPCSAVEGADDVPDGKLSVNANLTPEQAIEATLGRGECELTDNGPWGYPYVCSSCGASFDADVNGGDFNYCPSCGRAVRA